jgi:hypothetical protein
MSNELILYHSDDGKTELRLRAQEGIESGPII